MTDHKAEAEKLAAMKYAVGAPIGVVRHNDALAQLHATLYVAELLEALVQEKPIALVINNGDQPSDVERIIRSAGKDLARE